MGQLVLLVVAAAWAAVLIPPLLRSRIENRPNSSVSDFRDQLSSLQRAMPSRGVAMRSMARPLAPSPLSRPAAAGRPACVGAAAPHGGPLATASTASRRRRHRPSSAPRRRGRTVRRHARGPQPRRARSPRPAARGRDARQAPPGQRAVRPGPHRRVHAVPRRHHQGAGDAVPAVVAVRRPAGLRLPPRSAAPARAAPAPVRGQPRGRAPERRPRAGRAPVAVARQLRAARRSRRAQRRRAGTADRWSHAV